MGQISHAIEIANLVFDSEFYSLHKGTKNKKYIYICTYNKFHSVHSIKFVIN